MQRDKVTDQNFNHINQGITKVCVDWGSQTEDIVSVEAACRVTIVVAFCLRTKKLITQSS